MRQFIDVEAINSDDGSWTETDGDTRVSGNVNNVKSKRVSVGNVNKQQQPQQKMKEMIMMVIMV